MSGGGFRASLFHLGVVRFLRDIESVDPSSKALSGITHITSVSGGSVIAAHLALNWEKYNGTSEDFDAASAELVRYIKRDVRGRILRKVPLYFPAYWLSVLMRRLHLIDDHVEWRWARVSTSDLLERDYSYNLYRKRILADLPAVPELYLLATDTGSGDQIAFTRNGLIHNGIEYSVLAIPLARAVAASSAFPGMFMAVSCRPPGATHEFRLLDGGVYDNLGVRKFDELLKKDEFTEVIVSDASLRFKTTSRRSFLEPITTPLRAADILFRRVYSFDRESAARTGENTKSKFTFLSLQDTAGQGYKQFPYPLLKEHQAHLQAVRTDLDKFSDLEIAALVRHGYTVAAARLTEYASLLPLLEDSAVRWNPVPKTKCKFAAEIISGETNEYAAKISKKLEKSAVRKLRFASPFDPSTYATVVGLCILTVGVTSLSFLAGLIFGQPPMPSPPTALWSDPIAKARAGYEQILRARERSSDAQSGFLALPPGKSEASPETWTTSQASYALTRAGYVQADNATFFVGAIRSRFDSLSGGRSTDFDGKSGCWYTRPSQHQLQAEPALWTLAAAAALYKSPYIGDVDRSSLATEIERTIGCLHSNKFYERNDQTGQVAFNVLARQTEPGSHSAYSTSLALLALVEMKKANLRWRDQKGAVDLEADVMIDGIAGWLEATYSAEMHGWRSVEEDSSSPRDEAANMQILAVLLDVYAMRGSIPPAMEERVRDHVFGLEEKYPADSSARVFLDTWSGKDRIASEVSIGFLWRPWAIRLCRTWYSMPDRTDKEKSRVNPILNRLTSDLSDVQDVDSNDYTFHSAEMLIATS